MTDTVKYFHSGMGGAPQMSNGMGQMISVLDACLQDGFNSLTPSGITRTGGVATITFGSAHGYEADQVLLVSGCDQSAYNGEQRILTVPTTTTLTFAVAGTPTTPATSATSFNTKAAPLGFAKIYSGTNKAMYQSQNVSTNQWILRLDGNAWTGYSSDKGVEYKVDICRSATGIDTMVENTTASAASFGQFRWHQSALAGAVNSTAPTTNIVWALYGNDKQFFFTVGWHSSYPNHLAVYGFGELTSFKVGDAYNTFLLANNFGNSGGLTGESNPSGKGFSCAYNVAPQSSGALKSDIILAKTYNGYGGWAQGALSTMGGAGGTLVSGATSGISAINPQDFSLFFFQSYVNESAGFRGVLNGMYSITNQLVDLTAVTNYSGLKYSQSINGVTKTFRTCQVGLASGGGWGYVGFDVTGPWG